MKKLLQFSIVFIFIMASSALFAQENAHHPEEIHEDHNHSVAGHDHAHCDAATAALSQESFTTDTESLQLFSSAITLIDIITSDEGADFNCSGGFCMIKSHYHKKGLTSKRQLFDYFMKISG